MSYLVKDDDAILWNAVKQDEVWAYEALFRKYYAPLAGYANTIIGDRDLAEGTAQEAFIKIWEKRNELDISTSIKSYLYRAVFNKSLNINKHKKVKQEYQSSARGLDYVDESTVTNFELKYKIQEAIDKLPEKCGEIFTLCKIEGMKYAEIAKELNISVKTVENQMGKALKLMRTYLKEFAVVVLAFIKLWIDK